MLFINIWDSLMAHCLVYNTAMYTVYGRCGQHGHGACSYTGRCGRCSAWFIRTRSICYRLPVPVKIVPETMTHVTGLWYQLAGARNWYRKRVNVSWARLYTNLYGPPQVTRQAVRFHPCRLAACISESPLTIVL